MEKIINYYNKKLKKYGSTYKGVDWNSYESQHLRFEKLFKLIDKEEKYFSILDYGCGYGALLEYIFRKYESFDYTGYDISKSMIQQAMVKNIDFKASWYNKINKRKRFDYVVASGIFNVKLNFTNFQWRKHIVRTLDEINNFSKKGFSFNILTTYSDKEKREKKLFYADPCFLFNHCKLNYSNYISLLHDYPLYEFTIIVKK